MSCSYLVLTAIKNACNASLVSLDDSRNSFKIRFPPSAILQTELSEHIRHIVALCNNVPTSKSKAF
jgi:hypothetical protein